MGVGAGLYIYDVVIKKFTFAISSRDEYPVTVYNSNTVMSCMRVCRKQALSRVKYYYHVINSKIQQQQ